MSDPSTEDLRSVFDELVGAPSPSGDLAERARRRGTALRRQRLSVVTAGVATVTVLVVPSVIAVRHDFSAGSGAGSKTSAPPKPVASAKPPVAGSKTDAPGQTGTQEQKQRVLLGTTLGAPPDAPNVDSYTVREQAPSAQDTPRIDAAKHLLGADFTLSASGIAINDRTGKAVCTSATFRTASGGSVGVVWATVDPTEKGSRTSTTGTAGVMTGGAVGAGVGAAASGDPAKDTVQTLGGAGIKGNVQISVKATMPAHGSVVLTPTKVRDLVNGLLADES